MRTNYLTLTIIMGLMMGIMISINPGVALSQSVTVSSSGTAIPPATKIVDSQNNTWTLSSSDMVLENGNPAGYSSNVVLILYYNGIIYQSNSAGGWWSWTGSTWVNSQDPIAQNIVSSINGTTIPPASQIIDSQNNTWTLSSLNTVLENGKAAGYSSNVAKILYYNDVIYQENSSGSWWSWAGGIWTSSSDPIPAVSGICGSANGTAFSVMPAANLCNSGLLTAVSGNGPWSWGCNGSNGGSNAACSALLLPNLVVSASGTTIPSVSEIIDSQSNIWTLSSSSAVLENGKAAGYSNNVSLILYYDGIIYQKNSAGNWWSWTGGTWESSSDPRLGQSGVCGSANGVAVNVSPTINICSSGSASTVTNNGVLWNWTCNATVCSAPVEPSAVNGTCGTANGIAVSSVPTANLCGSGVPTAVSGSGPWNWSCDGMNGGNDLPCSASLLPKITVSTSGTTIPSASEIVDGQENTWTLSSAGAVLKNGNSAGYTNNVVLLLYYNGIIYQKNSSADWWEWTNGTWTVSSDPRTGMCGTANGVAVSSVPTTNLCNSGATTAVSGNGPWTWSCVGSNGTTVPCSAPSTASLNNLFGANLAGAEFGQTFPGTYGVDYAYPTSSELAYYKSKGLTLMRVPFAWERMQPTLNGPLDPAQVSYMTNFLSAADTLGISVILDLHNYGRYGTGSFSDFTTHGNIIGTTQVPVSAFANFWSQMAAQFMGHSSLLGYDIMNEPHDMGGSNVWPTAAQAAVSAIRTVDTAHTIFVEGDGWAGAWSWMTYNANLNINDPSGHLAYEAHQYFDSDNSGTYTSSYDQEGAYPTVGVDRLQPYATWLTQHGYKGWVGEYGVPNNDPRWLVVLNNFMGALKSDGIWGTYWAGGPWWGNYTLSCEPSSGQDTVQMSILQNYPSA